MAIRNCRAWCAAYCPPHRQSDLLMDLGLKALSDDQAIALLQEVLQELASRDPFVRNIAQRKIIEESEKLDVAKACLKTALARAKEEYKRALQEEIYDLVFHEVAAGSIKVATAAQEADWIAESAKRVGASAKWAAEAEALREKLGQDIQLPPTVGSLKNPFAVPDNPMRTMYTHSFAGYGLSPSSAQRVPPSPKRFFKKGKLW